MFHSPLTQCYIIPSSDKNQHLSMQKQKEFIADSHSDWKGSASQIDDILIMGLVL